MKTNIHFWSYLAQFFLEWEMFQTKVVEKIKTHVLCSVTFFLSLEKFKFHWNLTIITGTLHEDQYTFLITSHSVLLRMRNVSDKSCRENQNTRFVFSNFFPRKSWPLWENVEEYCRAGQATDGNMAHAHCMLDT